MTEVNMGELKLKAIDLFKNNPDKVGIQLLQRKLGIGVIKANKILYILEDEGVISEYKDGCRKLLI